VEEGESGGGGRVVWRRESGVEEGEWENRFEGLDQTQYVDRKPCTTT
jgi:hypothetical protein